MIVLYLVQVKSLTLNCSFGHASSAHRKLLWIVVGDFSCGSEKSYEYW